MNRPFPAYTGTDSYVFVCYAHRNAEKVYSDLLELSRHGINLWYDEGIPAGASWRSEIAAAIMGAEKFLFFISEDSLNSTHCLREVDYALNNDIEIITVYLDDSSLPGELELSLNRVPALFRETDILFAQHLLGAVQGTPGPSSVPLRYSKRRRLPPMVVGSCLLLLLFWTQRDLVFTVDQVESISPALPAAFDRYLEGLELLDRWDREDNLDASIALFREAAALDPDFALAYARLAEASRMRYNMDGDESWLEDAAKSANEAMRLGPALAPVQVALGRVQYTQGNTDLAFAALGRALSIDPNDAEANQAMALVLQRQGRPADAEAAFQKALALDQESILIRDSYASFLFDLGRLKDAAEQWQAVVRRAPDHFGALVNLGTALTEIGRTAEAITMYQQATEIRPSYMAYSNLGTAYARAERYSDAIAAYRQALELNDSDWLAWGNLAYVLSWENGMDSEAVDTFEHAIGLAEESRQRNSRDPWVYNDLGLYYAKTGQRELALQRVARAMVLSPESGEIQAAAAEAFELLGERDRAIELAKKAIDIGFPWQQFQRNPELADLLLDPRMRAL